MSYITKINIDEAQYSTIETIKKLDVDGISYNIGLDTSDANAITSDIKQGKTAYVNGQKITGSLAPYGPQTITPTTKNQSFGPGVYLNGQITVLGSVALIPENIKSGVNIFGVVGNLSSSRSIAIAAGSASNGTAALQYFYSNFSFARISGSSIIINESGSYDLYAYGLNPSSYTGTRSNRYLKINSSISGSKNISFTQPTIYNGYAIWNGSLAAGDSIQALWESTIKNGVGMPAVFLSILKY